MNVMDEIKIKYIDGKIDVEYKKSWWVKDDGNEKLKNRIESALKLKELVKERMKGCDCGVGDCSHELLQSLIEESENE